MPIIAKTELSIVEIYLAILRTYVYLGAKEHCLLTRTVVYTDVVSYSILGITTHEAGGSNDACHLYVGLGSSGFHGNNEKFFSVL